MQNKVYKIFIPKDKFLVLLLSILSSCQNIESFFFSKEPFAPCDPSLNYYENDNHFISDELLTRQGTMDYIRLLENLKPEKSLCDPIKNFDKNSK